MATVVAGSFSAAARLLDISPALGSGAVQCLEVALGSGCSSAPVGLRTSHITHAHGSGPGGLSRRAL
ncbi:helix-turn-helix domain-containing protein [Pseudomonas capeferrum]|uniref:helix-turn-helix domain-containing protein n=1 Tax=Pseudomonas capeferrum TaxID=1495066 RepID=UPI0035C144E8